MNLKARFARKMLGCLLLLICSLFLLGGIANATLIDMNNGVIHDDTNDLYWIQDLSMFNDSTYQEQVDGISALDFAGVDDWHMASYEEISSLWDYSFEELTSSFFKSGNWANRVDYWSGRYDRLEFYDPTTYHNLAHMHIYLPPYNQYTEVKHQLTSYVISDESSINYYGAWAVATAPIDPVTDPVPEPATMLLFGLGLLGLAGVNRKNLI